MNYGFLSLLPPIVAVVMAIKSKNVILSLFCGGFVGALIFAGGNPFLATKSMIGDYFFIQLTDSYNAGVIVLIVFIGGVIKLMEKSGGAHAFGIPYGIAVGAVLSGGLFGDHCSPISDTTILSSTGAQCDLVDHVKTQLPYACVNGGIAFMAFIFAGFTRSPLAVVLSVAILLAVMTVWGKKSK